MAHGRKCPYSLSYKVCNCGEIQARNLFERLYRFEELTPLEQDTIEALVNHIASASGTERYEIGASARMALPDWLRVEVKKGHP